MVDPIELTFLLTAIAGLLVYVFLVYNFSYWKKRGVDGPKPRALFGNYPGLITQSRNAVYDIDDIYRVYKTKERFAGIFSIRTPQLLITDPKLCQDILVKDFKNFHDNESSIYIDKDMDPIMARNPFFISGSEWKDKRAEVTPALTSNRIKASYPVMLEVCTNLTKYMEGLAAKPPKDGFNIKELAAQFTIEVVANCIYGIEAGVFKEGPCPIRENGTKIIDQSIWAFLYFVAISVVPFITRIYRKPTVNPQIEIYFTKLMEQAIKLRKETKSDRVDFLNYLLELQEKKNLSPMDLAAHTMTFFMNGYETSSIVIASCLQLLAENPDAQQKLRDEINAAYASNEGLTYEKLLDLPYLDQCINETLRMRPPILYNTKLCSENCEIRSNKDKIIKLDQGTIVLLPYYSIHHDPDYYPDPEKFDPDRFSPENGGVKKYKDMGVFLAFGDGPRVCLGMRFGMCQSKAAVVEIIRNWQVSINPKTKPEFIVGPTQFFCLPDGGIWLDICPVNK